MLEYEVRYKRDCTVKRNEMPVQEQNYGISDRGRNMSEKLLKLHGATNKQTHTRIMHIYESIYGYFRNGNEL